MNESQPTVDIHARSPMAANVAETSWSPIFRDHFGNLRLVEVFQVVAIILFSLTAVLFMKVPFIWDDIYFSGINLQDHGGLPGYLLFMFQTWSSRIVIEAALITIIHRLMLWRILTGVALAALAIVPVFLISREQRHRIVLLPASALLVASLPRSVLFETGYITTTLHYLWPMAAGLVAAIPGVRIIRSQRIRWPWVVVCAAFGIYAASSELAAALLLVCYATCIGIATLRQKRQIAQSSAHLLILIGFACLFLAFAAIALLAPGPSARAAAEVVNWFPTYPSLSRGRIVEIGFTSVFRTIFLQGYLLVLIFVVALAMSIHSRFGFDLRILSALAPVLAVILLGFSQPVFPDEPLRIVSARRIWDAIDNYGLVKADWPFTWVTFSLFMVLFLCMIYCSWIAGPDLWHRALLLLVLGGGFATKFVMAFSPTVWASGDRTNTYLLFSFGLASLLLLSYHLRSPGASRGADGVAD